MPGKRAEWYAREREQQVCGDTVLSVTRKGVAKGRDTNTKQNPSTVVLCHFFCEGLHSCHLTFELRGMARPLLSEGLGLVF